MEPIRRTTRGLRARQDGNPTKFGKLRKSLPRLERGIEAAPTVEQQRAAIDMYRTKMQRMLSMSTTRLRIAPGTNELYDRHEHDLRMAIDHYHKRNLIEAKNEMRYVTRGELNDIRAGIRRERIEDELVPHAVRMYERERLLTEQQDVESLSPEDVEEARAHHRRSILTLLVQDSARMKEAIASEEEDQLAKAEMLTEHMDNQAIVRTLSREPVDNKAYVHHWWESVPPKN